MREKVAISERRACRLMGLARSVLQYEPRIDAADAELQGELRRLAAERRRFGYRRDGPGDHTFRVGGVERKFYDYIARGVPYGPDDGTLAPWAVVASIPFAPEIVLPTVRAYARLHLKTADRYGFKASFNPSFGTSDDRPHGWVSPFHFGINEGPTVLMIENHRSAMVWSLMRKSAPLVAGLRAAGFSGGWLD